MSQMIGFDRSLRLDWLDAAAGVSGNRGYRAIRNYLHAYLAESYPHYTARRKTITCWRVWAHPIRIARKRQGRAAADTEPDDRIWLHWGMCLLAYPFSVMWCGRWSLLRYYGSFQTGSYPADERNLGERATMPRAHAGGRISEQLGRYYRM